MSADARTLSFYQAQTQAYAERAKPPPHLNEFTTALPAGATILDLGCGAGQDSASMRDAGFDVVSMDASRALAEEAKRRWNVDVRVLDFADLDEVERFDGVWANASLHHAQRADLPGIFARMRRALKPGGLLHASLKEGAEDRRDKFGRFFCAMDADALGRLVDGWASASITRSTGTGFDDELTHWLRVAARR
ncbi:MAG: class I SAM-dependent methyltransferase [Hyphomonadaceae bacterium]